MKKWYAYLIVLFFLFTSASSTFAAGLDYAREHLKTTSKTQGDVATPKTQQQATGPLTCQCQFQNNKWRCECPCPACQACPAATTAPTTIAPPAATGKGTSGGGGTIRAK